MTLYSRVRQFPGQFQIMARAVGKAIILVFKVYPMLPSGPLDWITPHPVTERVTYRASHGETEGQLYRPATRGPHPGIVVCLGVVPFGVEHPQVPRLGESLARSGFAALLYWSPAMRDFRLDPADIDDVASAYEALLERSDIDPTRSGLVGACVGGSLALLAAASPQIRDRVNYVLAYAPYASMWTLARDIASASRFHEGHREPWEVDQLTRKVYVHSFTAVLAPEEREYLRVRCAERRGEPDMSRLSEVARAIATLLTELDAERAQDLLRALPDEVRRRLDLLSPISHIRGLRAPLVVLLHDRDDGVIPVGESRLLHRALSDHVGVHYTEFTAFRHLDPSKGNASPIALGREFLRFGRAIYPFFARAA